MTSYNEWLKDWLNAGNMPTHFYLRNGANDVTPWKIPKVSISPLTTCTARDQWILC